MHKLSNMARLSVALALLAAVLLATAPALAAKEARAARYDVTVAAQADGSVLVSETVVFVYTGGPFTFVTRSIPAGRTDGLTGFEAYMDGARLPEGDQPGQVEISGGDPVEIVWHFAPTSDATHEFTLVYRALGVVEKSSAADILRWQALPDEHDYAIESSTITLTYPVGVEAQGAPTAEGVQASIESQSGQITIVARNLGEDTTLIVEQRFAPGSLTSLTPNWQVQAEARAARTRQYAPYVLALAGLIVLAGGGGVYALWRRAQPEPVPDAGPIASPPGDLPPALVGALNSGTGDPSAATALGTLFDLGQRGVVEIEQRPAKGWLGRADYTVTLRERPGTLRPHEAGLLDEVFGPGAAPGATAALMEKLRSVLGHWKRFAEPVKAEVRQAGWMDEARKRQRARWVGGGVLLLMGALGLLVLAAGLGLPLVGEAALMVPLAVAAVSMLILALGASLSPYTDQGRQAAARWKAFGKYLEEVTKGREAVTRPDLFERYLPYAAGLGLADGWLKFFKRRGEANIPAWFRPLMAGDTGGFAAMIAATSSTASSSGAGGAAGAGAAGGGASGTG